MQIYLRLALTAGLVLSWTGLGRAEPQEVRRFIFPEQRNMEIRSPGQLPRARLPEVPPPLTVTSPEPKEEHWTLSLDEAIRIALINTDVVRIAAGETAVASGATIYDPAITNTRIDSARGNFDPRLESRNTFSKLEQPFGVPNPAGDPDMAISANPTDNYYSSTGVSKPLVTGGSVGVEVDVNHDRYHNPLALSLNPQTGNGVAMRMAQPLLKGAGSAANLAPIVIARIDTERSFFQLKDSVQDLVLSVIQTYWNLSYAQLNVWAREQQVEQGREALDRAEGRVAVGFGDESGVAQARVSYEGFRAQLVSARANLLTQEAVLRNLLGLPPSDHRRIELATAPLTTNLETPWESVVRLAEEYRPDIIELKLVLEADEQNLLISRNQALPQLDIGALYRWNGLEGRTPDGWRVSSRGGEFADWEAGVTFSVPLGLRKERAAIREKELILMRDRVNLHQALHAASHDLAASYRNLAQYYEQYVSYRRMREAARLNLERQMADFLAGRGTLYLTVLQAVTDWGNAVTSEYQSLVQYNIQLAQLERETGTILETHGVRFFEERYGSIGPLGRLFADQCYPRDMRPGPNADRPQPPDTETYRRPEGVERPDIDGEGLRPGSNR